MNDAKEFIEAASKKDESYERSRQNRLAKAPDSDDSIENTPIGKLVQYQFNGDGFAPTTATRKTLPVGIFSVDIVNHMLTFVPRNVQTDNLIRLPDSKSDEVIKRVQSFWEQRSLYKNGNDKVVGGYLHKKGFLLWGPPGSGKTCTVKHIMNDVKEKGGMVILADGHPAVLAAGLRSLRSIEPDRKVVIVLEDFDALIHKYDEESYLSILDGENSIDGAFFVATTNYPSRLDPRIYNRPGRMSDTIKIGMPTDDARRVYLESQLKDRSQIDDIVRMTKGFSIDHLKFLIIGVYFEGHTLAYEVDHLRSLFQTPKDDQGNAGSNRMGIG